MKTFTCEHCHKEFPNTKWQKDRRYCSFDCSIAARRQAVLWKECPQCGKKFTHRPQKKQVCCSKECADQRRKIPGSNSNTFTCATCGIEFVDTGWAKTRKYCSIECSSTVQKRRKKVSCVNCGKVSERTISWAMRGQASFCDRDCRDRWQSGEKHPKFKGGGVRWRGSNWLSQARKARDRDNHCCQHCGISEKKSRKTLDVHHVIPFREFGIKRYKEANDLSNLISLCRTCHARAEHGRIAIQPKLV